jgi:hypothetical protein
MRPKVYGSDICREQFELIRPLLEVFISAPNLKRWILFEVFCGALLNDQLFDR